MPSYFLWQSVFNLYRYLKAEIAAAAGMSLRLGSLPWLVWAAMLAALTFAAVRSVRLSYRFSRTYITPLAIRQRADRMNCGLCYYFDSGRVIFSNDCMNRLCMKLTDERLLNGARFREAVPDGIRHVGGTVWSFSGREMAFRGSRIYEMTARDVTEIHTKTETLRRDNTELARLNEELRAYSLRIDETVRGEEILDAKVSIHDEMNRLMLASAAADSRDAEAFDRIFRQWNQNAVLLCREAEQKSEENGREQLSRLAGVLGVRILRHGEIPAWLSERDRELVFTTAQEAVINAVKHAGTRNMDITFEEDGKGVFCRFENDGRPPEGEVRFTGGLANLKLLAEEAGAILSADCGGKFRLKLFFPKIRRDVPIGRCENRQETVE